MKFQMNKNHFKRGQVWYKVDELNTDSRVQSGSRPVVIYSSDSGNILSDLVNVIPITSETKPDLKVNVKFIDHLKRKQTILCNMLHPCDKYKLRRYMFTIPDEIMEQIEQGVAIANDMKYLDKSQLQLFNQFKSFIDGIMLQRFNEFAKSCKDDIDSRFDRLEQMIKSTSKSITDIEAKPTNRKKEESQILHHSETVDSDTMKNTLIKALSTEESKNSVQSKKDNSSATERKKKSTKRKVWDIETCKQYVEDKFNLSSSAMAEKYDLPSSVAVSQYYSYCRNKLNKNGINYTGK